MACKSIRGSPSTLQSNNRLYVDSRCRPAPCGYAGEGLQQQVWQLPPFRFHRNALRFQGWLPLGKGVHSCPSAHSRTLDHGSSPSDPDSIHCGHLFHHIVSGYPSRQSCHRSWSVSRRAFLLILHLSSTLPVFKSDESKF